MTDTVTRGKRPPLRVGLIGFGAIGRRLAEAITAGQAGRCELGAVLVRRPERIEQDVVARLGCTVTGDAADFLATRLDLVVEVAGHDALKAYAEDILRQGHDLLLISVGALADPHFELRLQRAAHDYGRRVYLATGAIAGLDAIAAAAVGGLESVTHWYGSRRPACCRLKRSRRRRRRACRACSTKVRPARRPSAFPRTSTSRPRSVSRVSGLDRTLVRVVADPTVVRNTHEIEARGEFGELRIVLQNVPTENPKTGRLTAMSIIKALRNLTADVVVGI